MLSGHADIAHLVGNLLTVLMRELVRSGRVSPVEGAPVAAEMEKDVFEMLAENAMQYYRIEKSRRKKIVRTLDRRMLARKVLAVKGGAN